MSKVRLFAYTLHHNGCDRIGLSLPDPGVAMRRYEEWLTPAEARAKLVAQAIDRARAWYEESLRRWPPESRPRDFVEQSSRARFTVGESALLDSSLSDQEALRIYARSWSARDGATHRFGRNGVEVTS